jgi:hypothetical protein
MSSSNLEDFSIAFISFVELKIKDFSRVFLILDSFLYSIKICTERIDVVVNGNT